MCLLSGAANSALCREGSPNCAHVFVVWVSGAANSTLCREGSPNFAHVIVVWGSKHYVFHFANVQDSNT